MRFEDFQSTPAQEYDYLRSCIQTAAQTREDFYFEDVVLPQDCSVSTVSLVFSCSPENIWSVTVSPAFTYRGSLFGIGKISDGLPLRFGSFEDMNAFLLRMTDPSLTAADCLFLDSVSPVRILDRHSDSFAGKVCNVLQNIRTVASELKPLTDELIPIVQRCISRADARRQSSSNTMPTFEAESCPDWVQAQNDSFADE